MTRKPVSQRIIELAKRRVIGEKHIMIIHNMSLRKQALIAFKIEEKLHNAREGGYLTIITVEDILDMIQDIETCFA